MLTLLSANHVQSGCTVHVWASITAEDQSHTFVSTVCRLPCGPDTLRCVRLPFRQTLARWRINRNVLVDPLGTWLRLLIMQPNPSTSPR
jgi:hypothetical protein